MISSSANPSHRPDFTLQLITVSIPLPQPLRARLLEQSLQRAIHHQIGEHQLLRWAITSVDPEGRMARVEAVVTLTTEPERT